MCLEDKANDIVNKSREGTYEKTKTIDELCLFTVLDSFLRKSMPQAENGPGALL